MMGQKDSFVSHIFLDAIALPSTSTLDPFWEILNNDTMALSD
jgi:hypothetical protein